MPPPNRGQFRSPLQTSFGSVITVECNEGYFLSGENNLQCVDEDNNGIGEWNKRLPVCQCEIKQYYCWEIVKFKFSSSATFTGYLCGCIVGMSIIVDSNPGNDFRPNIYIKYELVFD